MLIDTHCHLNDETYKDNLDEVIKEAANYNVKKIMVIGYDLKSSITAIKLSNDYSNIYPVIGIHPEYAKDEMDVELQELEELIKNNLVYGIGECGLDYHYEPYSKEFQIKLFKKQIELSIKYDLPLVIHMRDAIQDTYDVLKEYAPLKGVMHSYSGHFEMANEFIKLGFMISFSGVLTFKNAKNVLEVAQKVPLSKIIIETDSPYLTPVPHRGETNEPQYVRFVAQKLSEVKGVSEEVVEEATTENAINLFRLERK